MLRRWSHLLVALCLGAPVASASGPVETSLFLIGDAGAPHPSEPVLRALTQAVAEAPGWPFVVFLGDNVYPRGIPAPGDEGRGEAERRLTAQVDAVMAAKARGIFIPGNHDWRRPGRDGWDGVLRQAELVRERGRGDLGFEPGGGCPGPVTQDLGTGLRLVVLDTEWWLRDGPKPRDPDSSCPADSEAEVLAGLEAALAGAGDRAVVVAAHHPLESGGVHGGHFGWKDHLFPLREWKRWLWLPLPGLGSLYPMVRQGGMITEDLPSARYTRMRSAFLGVLGRHHPLAWASGHEHSLQVIEGDQVRYLIVSGAGIVGHTRAPGRLASTLFASGEAGFFRLDLEAGGGASLAAVTVGKDGGSREGYRLRLR
jgi:hypothetical protein